MVDGAGAARQNTRCPCIQFSHDCVLTRRGRALDTDELDVDVNRERFLEGDTLFPADLVATGGHLVRERYLLVVTGREETDIVDHAGQRSCGVCASGEAKDADLVTLSPACSDEGVNNV